MKALIKDNKVVQVSENEFPVHPSLIWMDCPAECEAGWILNNGQLEAPVIPPKTQEEILEEYKDRMQSHVDLKAQEKNYKNGFTCATYTNSTNAQWKAEADAFIAWRDDVWEYAIGVQTQVEAEEIEPPTLEDFINNAPSLIWPE